MAEWRAGHWAAALAQQGLEGSDIAAKLQECFDRTRIDLFRFEPGVKVRSYHKPDPPFARTAGTLHFYKGLRQYHLDRSSLNNAVLSGL